MGHVVAQLVAPVAVAHGQGIGHRHGARAVWWVVSSTMVRSR